MIYAPGMVAWGLASGGSQVDVVARWLAVAGIIIALGSAVLTWQLWRRSGPGITVLLRFDWSEWEEEGGPVGSPFTQAVEAEGSPVGSPFIQAVEVVNSGRMPAVIREVRLVFSWRVWKHDRFVKLEPAVGGFPVAVPPTGFIRAVFPRDQAWPEAGEWIWAEAIRGDGRRYKSRRLAGDFLDVPPPGYIPGEGGSELR